MSSHNSGTPASADAARLSPPTKNKYATPVYSSPVRSEDHPLLQGIQNSKLRYEQVFNELAPYFRGEMSATTFISEYLPLSLDLPKKGALPQNISDESDFIDPLPNFVIANTSKHAHPSGAGALKVDLSVYTLSGAAQVEVEDGFYRFNPTVCELPIERKAHDEDPFKPTSGVEMTGVRRQALGQLSSYCAEILACQHRTHLFSIFLFPDSFRLFRWDPAGIVVTKLEQNFAVLQKFLHRFNASDPAQRGLDPTVQWASPAEAGIFKASLDQFAREHLRLDEAGVEAFRETHLEEGLVAVMQVGTVSVLVGRPVCVPARPVGRRTRGYFGVRLDPEDGQHATGFVKDTWRLAIEKTELHTQIQFALEGDLLMHPKISKIDKMAKCLAHGDVSASGRSEPLIPQTTVTDQHTELRAFVFKYGTTHAVALQPHTHYRLFSMPFGMPILNFRDGQELVNVIHDVLLLIVDAYHHDRLHRDVSLGNIIMVQTPGELRAGHLIDWEFSCDTVDHQARDRLRIGTRAFMSARILLNEDTPYPHRVFDDIESLSYVFLLLCLQWMKATEHASRALVKAARMLFGTGGDKLVSLQSKKFTGAFTFNCSAIQKVWDAFHKFTESVQVRQSVIDGIDDPNDPGFSLCTEYLNQTLDDIKRGGSVQDQAARDRPFGQLLAALSEAKLGPWDSAERLPDPQISVTHRAALVGPLYSTIAAMAANMTTSVVPVPTVGTNPRGTNGADGQDDTDSQYDVNDQDAFRGADNETSIDENEAPPTSSPVDPTQEPSSPALEPEIPSVLASGVNISQQDQDQPRHTREDVASRFTPGSAPAQKRRVDESSDVHGLDMDRLRADQHLPKRSRSALERD